MNEEIKREIIQGAAMEAVEKLKHDNFFADKVYAQIIANNPRRQTVIKIGDNLTIGLTMFCTILLTGIACFVFAFIIAEEWRQEGIAELREQYQQAQKECIYWCDIHRSQVEQLGRKVKWQ